MNRQISQQRRRDPSGGGIAPSAQAHLISRRAEFHEAPTCRGQRQIQGLAEFVPPKERIAGTAAQTGPHLTTRARGQIAPAFTVIELLVVIGIMLILAAVGLPVLKGFGKSNATISAQRQLLDDIALARQRAIANRTDVYMVFVPPAIVNFAMPVNPREAKVFVNLLGAQYTGYALLATRQVGEQPGQHTSRYLSEWKTLPAGTFIATNKYVRNGPTVDGVLPFQYLSVPFPLATSAALNLPCIVFNFQGQLRSGQDEVIPLARGSIFYARDATGQFLQKPGDVQETPPGNSRTNSGTWNFVHIDWLTGRARVEHQEIR